MRRTRAMRTVKATTDERSRFLSHFFDAVFLGTPCAGVGQIILSSTCFTKKKKNRRVWMKHSPLLPTKKPP